MLREVPDGDPAVGRADRDEPAVRADVDRPAPVEAGREPRRVGEHRRGQHRAARLGGVAEAPAVDGLPHGAHGVDVGVGQRLGGRRPGLGVRAGPVGVHAGDDRDDAGDDRDHQQRRQARDHATQPAGRAPPVPLTRPQEGVLVRREVGAPAGPVEGRREPGAAVEVAAVLPPVPPRGRRLAEPLAHEQAPPVLLDPLPQAGPRGQQRVVARRHGVRVDGDEPGRDQPLQDVRRHLGPVGPAPGDPAAVEQRDHAQHRGTQRRAVRLGEPLVHTVRGESDGPVDPAGALVPGEGEPVSGAVAPGLAQRVRQAGQRAGVAAGADVGDQPVDEPRLQVQAGRLRGPGDHPRQLVGRHGTEHERRVQRRLERGQGNAVLDEVGAHGDHDPRRPRAGQRRREQLTFALVTTLGEQLLGLVDGHDQRCAATRGGAAQLAEVAGPRPQPLREQQGVRPGERREPRGERADRPRTRRHGQGLLAGARLRGQQAGVQQRRLPRAGRADDNQR